MLRRMPCQPPGCTETLSRCAALPPQVAKEDIELVAQQFDLDKKKAERCLREAKGDVKAALRSLLSV